MARSLSIIAREIDKDWSGRGTGVNYAARPYLDAMKTLNSVSDRYVMESGKSVVLYFLTNAGAWRGEHAKRIRSELKEMVK